MRKFRIFSFKRLAAAILTGLLVSGTLSSMASFAVGCEDIRGDVLRLHILANSDSKEDQALKLAVRDRLLALDSTLFYKVGDLAAAKEAAASSLGEIRRTAEETLRENGSEDSVQVVLTRMYFATREYENYTLPAGMYDALRIVIGRGEGHNWWCVLYPPLCLPAAEKREELEEILTAEELKILESGPRYRYRFALVELWEKIKGLFD